MIEMHGAAVLGNTIYNMSANQGPASRSGTQRGRAPEYSGGTIKESKVLDAAEKYLGKGYTEVGKNSGRYVSKNGLRQVRFGKHEVSGKNLHMHFEAFNVPGGRIIENTVVKIIP